MWLTLPPSVILTWPVRKPGDPIERRGNELWIVTAVFLTAAAVAVSARLYARLFVRKFIGIDDIFVVLGLLCSIGVSTCVGIGHARYGWDRHIWDTNLSRIEPSSKVLFVSRILWGLASSLVRLSVLCLYYRLLRECHGDRYRWILHVVTVGTVGLMIMYLFTGIFTCTPVHAYWTYAPGRCYDDRLIMFIAACLNTVSEFVVAMLPVLAVFYLGVMPSQRWSVLSLLSLGFFVVVAGCCRTYYIHRIWTSWDVTWWATPHFICSEVEIGTALVCACAPSLRPVFGRLYRRVARFLPERYRPSDPKPTNEKEHLKEQRAYAEDFDAVTSWETSLLRAVDLEGLSSIDGLGYSVQIIGPRGASLDSKGSSNKKSFESENCMFWLWRGKGGFAARSRSPSLERRSRDTRRNNSEDDRGMTIQACTSVHLRESFRGVPLPPYRRGGDGGSNERSPIIAPTTGWDPTSSGLWSTQMEQAFSPTQRGGNIDDKSSESFLWPAGSTPMTMPTMTTKRDEEKEQERTETEVEDYDRMVRDLVKDLAISPVDYPEHPSPVLFKEKTGNKRWRS